MLSLFTVGYAVPNDEGPENRNLADDDESTTNAPSSPTSSQPPGSICNKAREFGRQKYVSHLVSELFSQ